MSIPSNHHYVAQAILQNFCYEGQSLYYFTNRRPQNGVKSRNIETIFKKRHLNSFLTNDGKRDASLELFFSKNFDDRIRELQEQIDFCLKTGAEFIPKGENFRFYVQFYYNHMYRTPEFHQSVVEKIVSREFVENSIRKFEKQNGEIDPSVREKLLSDGSNLRLEEFGRVKTLGRQSEFVLDMLAEYFPVVATPMNLRKQFIVSSNPVIRLTNSGGTRLDNDDIELWSTLSPRIAFGLVKKTNTRRPLWLSDAQVRHLNLSLTKNSIAIAGANEKLVSSLSSYR